MNDTVRSGDFSWEALIDTERLIVIRWLGEPFIRPKGSLFIWVRKDLLT